MTQRWKVDNNEREREVLWVNLKSGNDQFTLLVDYTFYEGIHLLNTENIHLMPTVYYMLIISKTFLWLNFLEKLLIVSSQPTEP